MLKRMQEERLPELIMEWIPGERRKRGRPRKTWMESIRSAMTTRHLEVDQWLNRKEWCLGSGRRRTPPTTHSNQFKLFHDNSRQQYGVTVTRCCSYSCFVLLKVGDSDARNMYSSCQINPWGTN